jgi:poly(beta-D-mannuronate) C5 epimerase
LLAASSFAAPAPSHAPAPRAKTAHAKPAPAKVAPEKPARLSKDAEDERDPYDEEDPDSIDQNDGSDYEDPNEPPPEEMLQQQISNQNYVVLPGSNKDVRRLETKPPSLPDLSPYTSAAARAKVMRTPAGRASVGSMLTELSFNSFKGHDERLREWAMRQSSLPQIIRIEGGYMTPADLKRQLPAQYFEETEKGVFVARLPIDIKPGATLQIGDDVKDFRLSLDRGAFLVNEGKLFITGSRLEAWNEAARGPAVFKDKHDFRPFLVSWAGSETYIVDSVVAHLGFAATKAYGVSISQFSPKLAPVFKRARPTGWLINSEFFDNWYGFYCYEADDVVIRGNDYHDNIKYGIDPHDRSRRLIIAENRASGTKEKHGIIVSREVNDSWIFDNKSFENGLSGIVVDRSSVNNVVAHNQVYRNHADGITIYESPNTLLWQNLVVGNERHGIRVRNSVDADLRDNVAIGNGLSGIYGHIKNLNETDRNIHLDPFSQEISMTIVGGQLVSNGSGPVTIDQPLSLELYDVDLRRPARDLGIRLTGVLGQYQEQVLDILVRRKLPVVVRPAGGAASEASG